MKVTGWTSKKLQAVVMAAGWKYVGADGGHRYYQHPDRPHYLIIPWHTGKAIKPKTAASILKEAGLR